jgi:hypothetical protein
MSETDDILKSLEDPTPQKKPTNWELWAALYFAEFIFVMLDAGSAVSVGVITGYWYYGLIVFLAGVIPLWLYTKTYTRPLADVNQKRAALVGGIVAVGSVLIVGLFVAVLNFAAKAMSANSLTWIESGLAVSLVLLLAIHGFINAYYFFTDDQVKEFNKTQRMIARGDAHVKRIRIAQTVANAKRREVSARQKLEREFSPAIVAKIMSMMADDDGDGIPNFIDPVDNRKQQQPQQPQRQFAKDVELVDAPKDPAGSQKQQPPRP